MCQIKILAFILIFLTFTNSCLGFFEIGAAVGSYLYQKSICKWTVCCNEEEIPGNFEKLKRTIKERVFGQPLVERTVINALKAHWDKTSEPDKALTISFHGSPGVGKNYVIKFIEESLYSKGEKSPHVHNFNARLDFTDASKVDEYKKNLAQWVRGNVSNCDKQLFVFDEVHHMPPGVLDVLKPFIDYVGSVNGISFRRAIFIFMSNTGSDVINDRAYDLWNKGIDRNYLRLSDFEKLIALGAFNEKGGFHHSDNIKSSLIDHYVPFLPLMKAHVILCIKDGFSKIGIFNPTDRQIQEVLDFVDWGPNSQTGVFSKTGCKRLSQKIKLYF